MERPRLDDEVSELEARSEIVILRPQPKDP